MKIVFMGTPDFAVGALEALVRAGHVICAVVTQPDKPKGRGKEVQMSPVKQCALQYNIPVFQPVKIREPEAVETLQGYGAELFVVAAFGQILTEEILKMPKFGCINIHASLLPKYRGASPIQWAILNGDRETGVTIQQMAKGIDTGDMLLKCVVPVDGKETAESLHDKLRDAGADMAVRVIPLIERGELEPEKQKEEDATYVTVLKKSFGHIDWSKDAVSIDRLVRGLNPWPSAYTYYHGKTLKIWECEPTDGKEGMREAGEAGSVAGVEKDAVYVRTGNGLLKVTQVQLEGKRRMGVKDFLLGCPLEEGCVFDGDKETKKA